MRYAFADCLLDTGSLTLERAGRAVAIEPQVFDLILVLVENADRVVTRDEIVNTVWNGRIVSESAISARIAAARKALGDDGKRQALIRTVARRGLQMVARVEMLEEADTPPPQPAPQPERQNIRFAKSSDGASMAYAVTGDGPPLCLIWHFPTSMELDWHDDNCRAMCDRVGRGRRLLRMDHRGSGQSDPVLTQVDFDQVADDICAVADAAGFDQFDLVGMSAGALFGTAFAARYPDRLRKMVLVGGYVRGRSRRGAEPQDENAEAIAALIRDGWTTPGSPFLAAFITAYYPDASHATVMNWVSNIQSCCTAEAMMAMRKMINTVSMVDILPRVRTPTLVVHSRGDAVHPLSEGRLLAQGIPNAQLRVVDGANHNPYPGMTGFDEFYEAMTEFLDT